jgi:hypothetical protein
MRLTDLDPRWYAGPKGSVPEIHGLSFECPHCVQRPGSKEVIRLGVAFHHEAAAKMRIELPDHHILEEQIWQISGEVPGFDGDKHTGFDHVTLSPSVDASKSGHWHGFIINGEIR